MLNIIFTFPDGSQLIRMNISGHYRCHGIKQNGCRPVRAHLYTEPVGSDFDIEMLEVFIGKYLSKVMHPTQSLNPTVSKDILSKCRDNFITRFLS